MLALTVEKLKKTAKTKGVKIYAIVSLTDDDSICVEVKKSSFLERISPWTEDDFLNSEIRAQITKDGDILI